MSPPRDPRAPTALPLDAPAATPLPAGFPSARELGLPRSARALYTRLAQEAPGDWSALLERIARHSRSFAAESSHSEFLPEREAQAIADRLPQLVAHVRDGNDAVAQRLAWVAGRYFEIFDDGAHDYEIGGLDDDLALFNAVVERVGAPQLAVPTD